MILSSFVCNKEGEVLGVRFTTHRKLEEGVLGVGSIPVAILPSCQYMKTLHYNCIEKNIIG